MFGKIWRWLKNLWQQLFTKPPLPSPPKKRQLRSDAEQESLFLQLLDMAAKGESRENIKRFLFGKLIDEAKLVAWLHRFRSNLLESPQTHRELARRMMQLDVVLGRELGKVAREIGRELLGNSETQTSILPISVKPNVNIKISGSVDVPVDVDGEAEEWFNQGTNEYNAGNIQEALDCLQRAITIFPNYDYAWNDLGVVLSDLGQYQQAMEAFQKVIAIFPNYDYAWNNLGFALRNLGQYQQAIEAYQKAIAISPNFDDAWNGLGLTLNELGQYQPAIEAYNRALEITHNQFWMAWGNRGWAIYDLHGYQAALRNWDEGLQSLQPQTRDYQEGCAVLHQFKGDAHYRYGKQQPNPHHYWHKSRNSYITALKTLSRSQTSILGEVLDEQVSPRFQLRYLEILQDLAKVCKALNRQEDFQLCLDIGDTMLENLLLETDSQERKIQLAKKFATFSQLRVVLLAQSSQLKEALLLAEKRKNLCLRWLRESRYVGISEETPLQYPEIEQFLSPGMAAIYWHYSPAAITTFIIKHDGIQIHWAEEPPSPNPFPRNGGRGEREDEDNVINFPLQTEKGETEQDNNTLTPLPVAGRGWGWGSPVKQLQKFEDWLKEWKKEYQLNRKEAKGAKEEKESWRDKMADRLDELGNILDIEPILKKIGDEITHLILIPHRDLHLLPLHYLFREKPFTITYLPSLKVGIDLSISPVGAKHSGDNISEQSKVNFPNASPSPVASENLSVEAKVNFPNASPSPVASENLSVEAKVKLPNASPSPIAKSTPKKLLSIENPQRDLLFAPMESSAIARLFGECDRIPSQNATISVVKTSLKNAAGCFHFTGHAYHDPNYPRNSALILASEPNLTLADIFAFNSLKLQLVCLAACETGITGKEGLIDEFVGLASGFLATGVSYVVSSLWRVEERSTALLMIQFYHYIIDEKIPPALALSQAQNWLRQLTYNQLAQFYLQLASQFTEKSDRRLQSLLQREAQRLLNSVKINLSDRPYEKPYYWAGFTITGAF
ncbi:MAG: CHAT domain-containing tetratricopeptide repeat protein [Phormidium sp.]